MICPALHMSERYSDALGVIAAALLCHDPDDRPSADAVLKTPLLQEEMRRMLEGRHRAAPKQPEPRYNRDREREELAMNAEAHRRRERPDTAILRDREDEVAMRIEQQNRVHTAR